MKTILVTGCAGFIGSNFCRLFANEFSIIGVDDMRRGSHPDNVPAGIEFFRLDIADAKAVEKLLDGHCDISGIVNFAAESHVDFSLSDDAPFWRTNVEGVRVLARAAVKRKIRLLQVSTDEVYGPPEGEESFSETAPLNPRNPYAASKAAAELLIRSYCHSYGLDAVITRGCNTMGPRQFPDKVVPKAIRQFLSGEPFPLYRTPAKRLWIGADDHAMAIKLAFEKGGSGEIYNVASGDENEIGTAELVALIRDCVGKGEIREVEDRAAYDLRYRIASEKLRRDLGWKPMLGLKDLVLATVRWYIENPSWLKTCLLENGKN